MRKDSLYESSPPSQSPDRRKVSFQEGRPTEIGGSSSASNNAAAPTPGKSSKWQPLATVEPSPIGDGDPFSLGDSDDEEKDAKPNAEKQTAEAGLKETAEVEGSKVGESGEGSGSGSK